MPGGSPPPADPHLRCLVSSPRCGRASAAAPSWACRYPIPMSAPSSAMAMPTSPRPPRFASPARSLCCVVFSPAQPRSPSCSCLSRLAASAVLWLPYEMAPPPPPLPPRLRSCCSLHRPPPPRLPRLHLFQMPALPLAPGEYCPHYACGRRHPPPVPGSSCSPLPFVFVLAMLSTAHLHSVDCSASSPS